jgi:N-acyl homoserine lactone hydrolase
MQQGSSNQPDLSLYVLETGVIECADFSLFSPNAAPGTERDMSVRSYLVVHPQGTLLLDTGIADAYAAAPDGERIADAIVFKVPRTLRSQLDELGIAPDSIDVLALSHLHVDHVGNLDLFPNARVLMQRAEHEAGFGPDAEELTLIPETYAVLDPDTIEQLDGDHDVFGDGTVVLTALPGHTPGHQGLLVDLPETGPVLLAIDIAYSADDYARDAVRTSNVDHAQSAASLERAKRIERERGATVWLHHDTDAQRAVRTVPHRYG